MMIADAIRAALDDWASDGDWDPNDQLEWLEGHVQDTVADWLIEHGYEFDEDQLTWHKKG